MYEARFLRQKHWCKENIFPVQQTCVNAEEENTSYMTQPAGTQNRKGLKRPLSYACSAHQVTGMMQNHNQDSEYLSWEMREKLTLWIFCCGSWLLWKMPWGCRSRSWQESLGTQASCSTGSSDSLERARYRWACSVRHLWRCESRERTQAANAGRHLDAPHVSYRSCFWVTS